MTEQRNEPDVRFWLSRKFWIVTMVVVALFALAQSGAVAFTPDQILDFFKWLLGVAIGGHVLTDVTSLVVSGKTERSRRLGALNLKLSDTRKDEAK